MSTDIYLAENMGEVVEVDGDGNVTLLKSCAMDAAYNRLSTVFKNHFVLNEYTLFMGSYAYLGSG